MKIVFAPAIAPAAWAIGESLLPEGFSIEVLSTDQGKRVEQLRSADFLMGLLLCNNGGANSYAVSEHAILLMLTVYRRLPELHRLVKVGQWKSSQLGQEQEHEIAGKTVGIVGLGMIGKTLARRLSGFEVNLLYCDPVRASPEEEAQLKVRHCALDDLLRESDIATLHAPADASTHHLICDRMLNLMKREAIVINCARGELVDEAALYRALKDGRIFAAGLDTFDPEPPIGGQSIVHPGKRGGDAARCRAHMGELAEALRLQLCQYPAGCARRGSTMGRARAALAWDALAMPAIKGGRQVNENTSRSRSTQSNAALTAFFLLCCTSAQAQSGSYPTKPIRFIVANSPGGGLDVVARLTSPAVSAALGQLLVVDNRAGATGSVAAELTAKSTPDGHTVLMGAIGNLAVNPHIYKGLGYDPTKDFAPVTFAVSGSNVLIVHPNVPVKTVQDLIALARSKPNGLTYGSSGSGNAGHLAAELLSSMAKIQMVHVPYKGGAPAMTALISGETQLVFASPSTAIPQVKSGRVRGLAVTTLKRSAMLPELPTIAESGLPGFETDNWYGIVVAAKTPRAIVERLNTEFARALTAPDVKQALLRQGLDPAPGTPEAFGKYIKAEYEKWGRLIREAGIRAN